MANAKLPGLIGTYCTGFDTGTLARDSMPLQGVVGTNEIKLNTEMEQAKRTLAVDIGQLILDITGIFDPKWAKALRELLVKLKQLIDKYIAAASDMLPDTVLKQLKELKNEVENFLQMKGGPTGKSSAGGKAGRKSSNTTKSQSKCSP